MDMATNLEHDGAIDRSIAEEQAKSNINSSATHSRTPSTSRKNGTTAGKRAGGKDASTDISDAPVNPDPAVFEAAFVIDDSDDPSRAGTPKPPGADDTDVKRKLENTTDDPLSNGSGKDAQPAEGENQKEQVDGEDNAPAQAPKPTPPSDLTPEIRQKLRKLEKLEATYPGTWKDPQLGDADR